MKQPTKKQDSAPQNGAQVSKVSLRENLTLNGKMVTKTLFDGRESMSGIEMQLHPAGILCRHDGRTFIVPYACCSTILLEDGSEEDKA